MFTDPNLFFNTTQVNTTLAVIVNGTMSPGYFEVIAEVQGLDILISLAIVQTIFIVLMFVYILMGRNLRRRPKT
jgi:hypothetical protein